MMIRSASTKNLYLNQILIPIEECGVEKVSIVVHLDPDKGQAYLMGLEDQTKPKLFSYTDVLGWLIDGEVVTGKFKENEYWKKPEEFVSEQEIKRRDEKYEVIKPIVENLPQFLSSRNYGKGLVEARIAVAKSYGYKGTRDQILKWVYRYIKCGQNINGLLRKPGTGKSLNKTYTKKTGPKRNEGRTCNGRMRNEEDEKHFIWALNKFVFCPFPYSLPDTYIEYQNKFCSDPIFDPHTGLLIGYELREDEPQLSLEQFIYFAKQYMTAEPDKLRKAQYKVEEYNKSIKGLSGKVNKLFGLGPGSDYQVDETPLAIELNDEFDRNRRASRPTCYSVVDMFSKAWVALMLTFAKASAHTAREVLFIAFRNKEKFCEEIGITLNEPWVQQGKATGIIVDNAEFASALTESFSKDANVEVSFNKEGQSQEKGLVERRHLSLEDFLYGRTPGVSRKYVQDFLKRRLRKNATLNIRELYQILIDYITRYNNHYPLQSLPLTKEMRKDNVKRTPTDVWNWGLLHRAGYIQKLDDETELYAQLLETGEVTVRRDCLFLPGNFIRGLKNRRSSKGLRFDCEWAYSTGVQEREIGKKYRCKFMRYSLSNIWIVAESGYHIATLSALDSAYEWWSAEAIQVDKIDQSEKDKEQLNKYHHEQNKTKVSLNAMVENAKTEKSPMSINAANTQDISVNRDIAIREEIKASQSQHEKIMLSNEPNIPDANEESIPESPKSKSDDVASIFAAKSRKNRRRNK